MGGDSSPRPTVSERLTQGAASLVEKTRANWKARQEAKAKEAPKKAPGKILSAREAEDLRETYTQALMGLFDFADQGIKFTTGGHEDPEIWSTIDEGDLGLIVDSRLLAAQHSAKAAASVRRTIAWYQKAAVYVIVGPRLWQTLAFYAEHGVDIPLHIRRPKRKLRVVTAEGSSA